jgi:hypothetical protein
MHTALLACRAENHHGADAVPLPLVSCGGPTCPGAHPQPQHPKHHSPGSCVRSPHTPLNSASTPPLLLRSTPLGGYSPSPLVRLRRPQSRSHLHTAPALCTTPQLPPPAFAMVQDARPPPPAPWTPTAQASPAPVDQLHVAVQRLHFAAGHTASVDSQVPSIHSRYFVRQPLNCAGADVDCCAPPREAVAAVAVA